MRLQFVVLRLGNEHRVARTIIGRNLVQPNPGKLREQRRHGQRVGIAGLRQSIVDLEVQQCVGCFGAQYPVNRTRIVTQQHQSGLHCFDIHRTIGSVQPTDLNTVVDGRVDEIGWNSNSDFQLHPLARRQLKRVAQAKNAAAQFRACPVRRGHRLQNRAWRVHGVPELQRAKINVRPVVGKADLEGATVARQADIRPGFVNSNIKTAGDPWTARHTWNGKAASPVNLNIANLGGIVFGRLDRVKGAGGRDVLVEIDHVGGQRSVRRIGVTSCRIGLHGSWRQTVGCCHNRGALQPVHLVKIGACAAGRVNAGAVA